jgi:hypothetical protein
MSQEPIQTKLRIDALVEIGYPNPTSSLLKNPVFLQAARGTWMYRHFQWL